MQLKNNWYLWIFLEQTFYNSRTNMLKKKWYFSSKIHRFSLLFFLSRKQITNEIFCERPIHVKYVHLRLWKVLWRNEICVWLIYIYYCYHFGGEKIERLLLLYTLLLSNKHDYITIIQHGYYYLYYTATITLLEN